MTLNKDDAVIKSFIAMTQQDLQTTLGKIEGRILQDSASCLNAQEFSAKVTAQIDVIPSDLQSLLNKMQSELYNAYTNDPENYASLLICFELIQGHCSKTLSALKLILWDFAQAVLSTDNIYGAPIFPRNVKMTLDYLLAPLDLDLGVFFGRLALQSTSSAVVAYPKLSEPDYGTKDYPNPDGQNSLISAT